MKKNLICLALVFSVFYLCSFSDYNNDIAPMSSDVSYNGFKNLISYINENYADYDTFDIVKDIEVAEISGQNPLNVNGTSATITRFSKTEIITALNQSTSDSSYGGCGPIAMIGIFDYFANALGYDQIIANPSNYSERIAFATKIFDDVPTVEVGTSNKQTLILPSTYETYFNKLIKEFGLEENISATNHLNLFSTEINYLKETIDNGIPVTIYSGFINSEQFAQHYFVCYGYVDYILYHKETKERLNKTFLLCHTNGSNSAIYCDADILNEVQCGIICYNVNYDNTNINADDFKEEFINHETGLGQYFFDPREEQVTTTSNYTFHTNRLRCSFIENEYLVLSANRNNAGTAYLEFELDNNIRALELDMGLWSGQEYFSSDDIIAIEYYDNGLWKRHLSFNYNDLSLSKDNLTHYKIIFPKEINNFRIYIKCNTTILGDVNKGRVVLDNIILKEAVEHVHRYEYMAIDRKKHRGICSCGVVIESGHGILSSQVGNRYVNCYYCRYSLDLNIDVVVIIYG